MRWPNAAKVTGAYLRAATDRRAVTVLPSDDLITQLPMYRVSRGPGSDDKITDSPLIDVETFAADEDQMWECAEDAREAMHALAGSLFNGALVDTVSTVTSPTYVDYGNPKIWRAVASYRLALRKR